MLDSCFCRYWGCICQLWTISIPATLAWVMHRNLEPAATGIYSETHQQNGHAWLTCSQNQVPSYLTNDKYNPSLTSWKHGTVLNLVHAKQRIKITFIRHNTSTKVIIWLRLGEGGWHSWLIFQRDGPLAHKTCNLIPSLLLWRFFLKVTITKLIIESGKISTTALKTYFSKDCAQLK